MTSLLCKLFIRHAEDVKNPAVRKAYGILSGVVGIILNLLLFFGKLIAGSLSGSVALRADAVNNLSDAGSQIISLVSFHISAKPADRHHPFGHARMEYVASMIVSMLILVIGYQLFRDSLDKILHPETMEFRILSVVVMVFSIFAKLWLGLFNRKIGLRIDSEVMKATMADSLSDAAATTAVLIATLIFRFTEVDIDGYMGLAVAALIVTAGIRILNETKNSILGEAPSPETVHQICQIVNSYPEALGIHDLMVHNYGPGRTIASLHVEVDGSHDVFATHDAIDLMERQIYRDLGIRATIHMDPIVTDDATVNRLREEVQEIVSHIDPRLEIHDFRLVSGTTHSNLIFDVGTPFELTLSDEELQKTVADRIRERNPTYYAVVTVDRQ